jgi:SAM-dependent methyltransferase
MTNTYAYDENFMSRTARNADTAAQKIIRIVQPLLDPESVLDVGCGIGGWVKAWSESGLTTTHGVDGAYIKQNELVIPPHDFFVADLNEQFNFQYKYDIVQTLDVAEHLRPENSDAFISSLDCHCAKAIIFGAAPPGQGGENHINEQSFEFWRRKIEVRGYTAFDCIRPQIAGDTSIPFWYRFNVLLYVRNMLAAQLPPAAGFYRLGPDTEIRDYSPLPFRLRKAALRCLSATTVTWLSKVKTKAIARGT